MKFLFEQRTLDYYIVEAETEDEALDRIHSGEVLVCNTKYEDLNLVRAVAE